VKNKPVKHSHSALNTRSMDPASGGNDQPQHPEAIDFHGASIINEQGEEIPITESMVQNACKAYIRQWEAEQKKRCSD
jgi:hypothetical protein